MPTEQASRATPRARKAVIPAAGMGTRFLPATKAVPKELLPVVDTPALEYIVAEASRDGLTELLVVTAHGKDAIADHFSRAPDLEAALEKANKVDMLASVRRSTELARLHFVRQNVARGLGDAVSYAATFVCGEPFAVLLGDDMIHESDRLLQHMLDVHSEYGGVVLALVEVPRQDISRYGSVRPAEGADVRGQVIEVADLVEKPHPDVAPSNLAVIGRYVLPPEIFDAIRSIEPGAGGEIQLTDAMRWLAHTGVPVHGVIFRGRRFDTGDRLDYLRAVVQLAAEHPELGTDFRSWLRGYVGSLGEGDG
jgi:UTP--glucose-1-phosphate uridylyltransferase